MGYTTEFEGKFVLNKALTPEHAAYLKAFAETRRMRRDTEILSKMPDQVREAVGLPLGREGGFFVGGGGYAGQEHDSSVLDYNHPPSGQPGLWCKWVPTEDGKGIEWNGREKFYDYVEWLQYLVHNFLAKWGYVLGGTVTWQGEDRGDIGQIVVHQNEVTTKAGRIVYDSDE